MDRCIGSRSLLFAAFLVVFSTSKAQVLMLGFGEEDYSTREGDGSGMRVAIHVQGQTTEDLTVRVIPVTFEQFRNRFGSIPSDISLQNFDTAEVTDFNNRTLIRTIPVNGGDADENFDIEIYDDNIQEQDEVFLLYMEVGNTNQQIEITRNVSVARIRRDTDSVRIGFEISALSVREDAGTLTNSLYIIRNGDTEQTLTIQLQISGIGADIAVNETFVLDPQDNRVPVPIAIIDDALPEYEEYFPFSIRRSPNDFGVQQQYFTLTVVDNDALVVGFDNLTSAVNIQEGTSMEFCVAILTPEIERDAEIFILTQPGNATENYYDLLDTGGRVSTSGRVDIALTTGLRESCVQVMAVEDEKLEWSRSFIVKMENADPSVLNTFNSSQVTVLITDNDGTPNRPVLLLDKLGLVNGGKDLYFEWTAKEDVRRPVAGYFGSISPAPVENTNSISRRQANTGQLDFSTPNTYFVIPNIDQDKELILQVCSRNEFGFNCSEPHTFQASNLPFITDQGNNSTVLPPEGVGNPTGLEPGIIAVIIIVVLVLLLVFCCLLLLLLCLLWPRLGGHAYFPSKIEKKKSQQYKEYRDEHSPSIDSESDDEEKPV